ncbi:MAG TPA: hypothetical protein VIM41_02220 [Gammaproteobacteria bacterium]
MRYPVIFDRIPKSAWYLLSMCVWGGAVIGFQLIRFTAYNLDEGAAMALLLNWSVSDQVVNPVTTFGGPDFRALLFIPLGLYWPGSMVAAKILSLIFCFIAALFLFRWSSETGDKESALVATGLLLITPVLIYLADTINTGSFLLAVFGAGMYLDKKYRASPHSVSGLYFTQMLVIAVSVTLHPMGLAYPLALAWQWYKNPKSDQQKKQVWTGIGITVLIILVMQTGWIAIAWGRNPLTALDNAVMGYNLRETDTAHWIAGAVAAALLALLIYRDFTTLTRNLLGSTLLFSVFIGLSAADQNWAMIAIALLLYRGIPALIAFNKSIRVPGFIGQRGLVFFAIMAVSLLFMQADKSYALQKMSGALTPRDQLIQRLAEEAADPGQPFLAASQWPAQTMIVCRRDVFKLPPARANSQEFLKSLGSITHIVFDHRDINNHALARNIADLGGYTATVDIQTSGVIVKIRASADEPADNAGNGIDSSGRNPQDTGKQPPSTN